MQHHRRRILGLVFLFGSIIGLAAVDPLTVSVSSATAKDYSRTKHPDGTFAPELYVIANGGQFPSTTKDASVERIDYAKVVPIVGKYLARQNYLLAPKAKDADLLIIVYWGQTYPFSDPAYNGAMLTANQMLTRAMSGVVPSASYSTRLNAAFNRGGTEKPEEEGGAKDQSAVEFVMALIAMEERQKDAEVQYNARLLGYLNAINEMRNQPAWSDVGGNLRELETDIADARYYVVVAAYDFKALNRARQIKVRWVTRISIGSTGNAFDERLAQMLASASSSFGENGGLRRQQYGNARVILGETKYLGEVIEREESDSTGAKPTKPK